MHERGESWIALIRARELCTLNRCMHIVASYAPRTAPSAERDATQRERERGLGYP